MSSAFFILAFGLISFGWLFQLYKSLSLKKTTIQSIFIAFYSIGSLILAYGEYVAGDIILSSFNFLIAILAAAVGYLSQK